MMCVRGCALKHILVMAECFACERGAYELQSKGKGERKEGERGTSC